MIRALGVFALLCSLSAAAAEKKLTLGTFLPTSMVDGQERFKFAEALAGQLSNALGQPVSARNFGRYEDFAKAAREGSLDLAVIDAWAAAEASTPVTLIALGSMGGQTEQRWGVVSRARSNLKDLGGKRLALTKGVPALDQRFVSNVVFGGDLNAQKHFKLVAVPSVESALKAVEVKGAEAALVPLQHVPKSSVLLYRSGRMPGVVVVSYRGDAAAQQAALIGLTAVRPFDKFVAAKSTELKEIEALIRKGPPKRVPVVAESPLFRLDTAALINLQQVGLVLPSFLDSMEIPNEHPDD